MCSLEFYDWVFVGLEVFGWGFGLNFSFTGVGFFGRLEFGFWWYFLCMYPCMRLLLIDLPKFVLLVVLA